MPIGDSKFKELPDSVNELIADRAIRHALYLERYKTQVANDILTEFNRTLEPELLAKIEKSLRRITARSPKMKSIFKDNGDLIKAEYGVMQAKLYEQLRDFSKVESAWLIKTLEAVTPVAVDFVAPSANIIKALVTNQPMEGALVKDWFGKLAKDTAFNVNRAIQNGMIEGEGIEKIVRRIKGTRAAKYTDGILNANRRHLRGVVRTSVSNVAHSARDEVYKENTDVVKGVQIIATLDTRTCIQCMNLDGKVFKVGEGRRPPFHYSCRCSDAPVLKSWKELGIDKDELPPATRASMNGQVPATQTYPAWLKKQSVAVQNDALGVKRAEMFRSGKLKLKEFISQNNRPFTLEQLEIKEGIKSGLVSGKIQALTSKQNLLRIKKSFVSELDSDYTKLMDIELSSLGSKFPNVAKRIQSIRIEKHSDYVKKFGKNSIANAGKPKDKVWRIAFDGKFFGKNTKYDLAESLKHFKKSGILVSSKVENTLTHEFGHHVHNSLNKAKQKKIFDIWWNDVNDYGAKNIEKSVSKYASTSPSEMFAECFVQWRSGKMSSLARKVIKISGF